jgi:hypothetical protein
MEVYQRGHNGLAGEINMRGPRRDTQLTSPTNLRKFVSSNNERRVLDGSAAVPFDQASAFKDRGVRLGRLAVEIPGPSRCQKQTGKSEQIKRYPHAGHGISSGNLKFPDIRGGVFGWAAIEN